MTYEQIMDAILAVGTFGTMAWTFFIVGLGIKQGS
jgi:hypothetical protein